MNPFTVPLPFAARCSPWLLRASHVMHGLVAVALLASWPLTFSLTAVLFGVLLSALAVPRELTAASTAFTAFLLDSQGQWQATTHAGEQHPASPCATPLVTALIILIPLRCRGHRYVLVLSPDTVNADTLRRLRVRLRFGFSNSATAF